MTIDTYVPRNMILKNIPQEHLNWLLACSELVHLDIRENVIEPNKPIKFVDFPENGVTSLVTAMEDGSLVEIATIGNEGFVGASILLGVDIIPEWAFCQVEGSSWRLPVEDFRLLLVESERLSELCKRYAATLFSQVAKCMGCNGTHNIESRCARWLLSTHDRVEGNKFYLTQEFLAMMLNVTRTGVNLAAGILQKAGLITYTRGNITILDRAGLEKASCPCYREIAQFFEQPFKDRDTQKIAMIPERV